MHGAYNFPAAMWSTGDICKLHYFAQIHSPAWAISAQNRRYVCYVCKLCVVRHAILAVIPIWVKKCNNAISPVLSAPRAIVAAPRPPATPGRIQCRLVGPKKNSWCRPGPQWSPTRVSSRLLQVALGVKRAGVSGPDGLQNAPRLRVLRTWHLRRA